MRYVNRCCYFIHFSNKFYILTQVAQYLPFSHVELQMFLRKFEEEELREVMRIKKKYTDVKRWIKLRMKEIQGGVR